MFENILICLFGLLMVNYLVIIARQRIVKIVIGILGNCFFGLSLFSDYIALPSYMIDLKYIFPSFMWCFIGYTLFWLILIFFLIDFYTLIMFSK